jgi:hypothetical protein
MVVVFDDPNNIVAETGGALDGSVTDDLLTVNGTRLWEFGNPASNPDLLFVANGASDNVAGAGLGTFLTINGAMDVTHSYPATSAIQLLDLPISLLIPGAPGTAQMLVNGSAFGPGGTDFDLTTDTDIFIAAVPEPGTMSLLALGMAGMGLCGFRSRRKAA